MGRKVNPRKWKTDNNTSAESFLKEYREHNKDHTIDLYS